MWDFFGKCKGNKEERRRQKELEKEKKLEENQELADRVVAYLREKDNGKKEFRLNYRKFYTEFPKFKGNLDAQKMVYRKGWMMWNGFGPILVRRIPIPAPDDKNCFFIT